MTYKVCIITAMQILGISNKNNLTFDIILFLE